jgi:hypothetical protein
MRNRLIQFFHATNQISKIQKADSLQSSNVSRLKTQATLGAGTFARGAFIVTIEKPSKQKVRRTSRWSAGASVKKGSLANLILSG